MTSIVGSAASGGGVFPQLTLTHSQTWVAPQTGNICLHLVGAGGGGSACTHTQNKAWGAGAGGYCKKNSLSVEAGDSFTVVVGVGGQGIQYNHGVNGGHTTVAGPGLSATLTANGGARSLFNTAAGGLGGAASNGDVNYTGGAGTYYGGGSVGVYSNGGSTAVYGQGSVSDAMGGGLAMSGYGIICGGHGADEDSSHLTTEVTSASSSYYSLKGGDLCGGGCRRFNVTGYMTAGTGGIGGGGGSMVQASSYGHGARGGDGIVLIQYLPW